MPPEERSARRGEDDQRVVQQFLLRDLGHQGANCDIQRRGRSRHPPQIVQQARPKHLLAARRILGRCLLRERVQLRLRVWAGVRQVRVGRECSRQEEWLGGALCAQEPGGLRDAGARAAGVPDAAQQVFQRDLARVLELHGGAPGKQRSARLSGHRRAGVVVQEPRAGLRQAVDIRRAHFPVAVAAQNPGGQPVHQDQQDIGLLAVGGLAEKG